MTVDQSLTGQERLADLDLDAAAPARRAGRVRRRPATRSRSPAGTRWCGRSATPPRPRTSTSPSSAWSWSPTPGPETGNRDHHAYVLRSRRRAVRPQGRGRPDSPLLDHHRAPRRRHRRHRPRGARRRPLHRARPRAGRARSSRSRTTSPTSTAPCGSPRSPPTARPATRLVDRSRYAGPYLPGYVARRSRLRQARGRSRSGCSRRSTTSSATSSSAAWTSGSTSTTGSWASRTWPSSSATTSPPSTPR